MHDPQPGAFSPLGPEKESSVGGAMFRRDSLRVFLGQKTITERWI